MDGKTLNCYKMSKYNQILDFKVSTLLSWTYCSRNIAYIDYLIAENFDYFMLRYFQYHITENQWTVCLGYYGKLDFVLEYTNSNEFIDIVYYYSIWNKLLNHLTSQYLSFAVVFTMLVKSDPKQTV